MIFNYTIVPNKTQTTTNSNISPWTLLGSLKIINLTKITCSISVSKQKSENKYKTSKI
jgi:hypothetical protein